MSLRRPLLIGLLGASLVLAGCPDDTTPTSSPDAGADATTGWDGQADGTAQDTAADTAADTATQDTATQDTVVDAVEDTVADAGEDTVADTVKDTVADTVEDTVADTVEDTVADTVEDTVADATEDTVADATEDTVADAVEDTAPDAVEDTVADAVEDTAPDAVEDTALPPCAAVDDPCYPADTPADGWVCVATEGDMGVCRAACEVSAGCPNTDDCLAAPGEATGFCGPHECTGFYTDDCGPGAKCEFFLPSDPAAGGGHGYCVFAGPGAAGSPCDQSTDCDKDTLCIDGICAVPACTGGVNPKTCDDPNAQCVLFPAGDTDTWEYGSCVVTCTPGSPADPKCAPPAYCRPLDSDPNVGACSQLCDPMDADPCLGSETGLSCLPGGPAGGQCVPSSCDGFFSPDCGAFADCTFVDGAGTCAPVGAGAQGDVCGGDSDCGKGLACVGQACVVPECATGTVANDKACADPNATCSPFTTQSGAVWDQGTCIIPCTPFSSDGACGADAWCEPSAADPSHGTCTSTDPANKGLGDACGPADCCGNTCADASVIACTNAVDDFCTESYWDPTCAGEASANCGLDCSTSPAQECGAGLWCVSGTCQTVCAVAADATAPGGCGDGSLCAPLSQQDTLLPVGICKEACDYHGGGSCTAPGDFCAMGEMFLDGAADRCVPIPGAFAGMWPLAMGDVCPAGFEGFCAPNGRCADFSGSGTATCVFGCATSEGAFGSTSHPDCPDPALTCVDVSVSQAVGLCQQL